MVRLDNRMIELKFLRAIAGHIHNRANFAGLLMHNIIYIIRHCTYGDKPTSFVIKPILSLLPPSLHSLLSQQHSYLLAKIEG